MKILLIPSTVPEELIMSTPIIRTLFNQRKASIDVIIKREYMEAFEANPYIEKLSTIEDHGKTADAYDLVIDLQDDKHTRKLKRKSSYHFSFRKNNLMEFLYVKTRINRLPNKHLVDRYFELLKPVGIQNDFDGLDYFIPDKDLVEHSWLPASHQNGYVVFAIGSDTKTQELPIRRMIELCDRINKPIILVGTKYDGENAAEIERFFKRGTVEEEKAIEDLNKKASIFNACGKFNLNQTASIIENASWVFTHENIYMHIAAAYKKQIFSIWGSSTPLFGKYPYETKFTVFENNKLGCRPCSRTGYDKCPKGHFKCMNDLTFDFYLPD